MMWSHCPVVQACQTVNCQLLRVRVIHQHPRAINHRRLSQTISHHWLPPVKVARPPLPLVKIAYLQLPPVKAPHHDLPTT